MFLQVLMSWIVKLYSSTTLLITRATGNISIHQFSKERIRTESHLFFKILVSSITLKALAIESLGIRVRGLSGVGRLKPLLYPYKVRNQSM